MRDSHKRKNDCQNFPHVLNCPYPEGLGVFVFLRKDGIFMIIGIKFLAEIESKFCQMGKLQGTHRMLDFLFELGGIKDKLPKVFLFQIKLLQHLSSRESQTEPAHRKRLLPRKTKEVTSRLWLPTSFVHAITCYPFLGLEVVIPRSVAEFILRQRLPGVTGFPAHLILQSREPVG